LVATSKNVGNPNTNPDMNDLPDQDEAMLIFDDFDDFDEFITYKPPTRDNIIREYLRNDHHTQKCIILNKDTANFGFWEGRLRSKLDSVGCAGHIFHEHDGIVPVHAPIPEQRFETSEDFNARKAAFMEVEHAAIYIVNLHLPKKFAIRYDDDGGLTAKCLYDRLAARYKRSRAKGIHEATRKFLDVRIMDGDTVKYSWDFLRAYFELETVTRMFCDVKNTSFEEYMLPEGTAKILLVQNTLHVEWLKVWRDSVKIEEETFIELVKSLGTAHYLSACGEQKCTRCKRHNHKIKDCLKFHPK
jgi:hypothetical protein